MRRLPVLAVTLASVLLVPQAGYSQSVISARSGLINYFEGVVFLDGQPLARKSGTFARMKDGSTLMTEFGRAEVLLTPETYLRIGEKSSIRMISDSISDTRMELLGGSSILDSARSPQGEFVSIVFKDSTIKIVKPGHYRIDADPPQLRVYEGIAEVTGVGITNDGQPLKIKAAQLLPLDGTSVVRRFTQGSDGLLDLWSAERGELIASNMVNSQTITDPLLDPGPGVPSDLASYIGYVPLASLAPLGTGSYAVAYGPFSPYTALSVGVLRPFPAATFLYAPRRYTSTFASRPVVGSGVGIGIGSRGVGLGLTQPRGIYVPRPGYGSQPTIGTLPPRGGGVGGGVGAGGGVGVVGGRTGGFHPVGRR
jgi:hypothetical protein